MTKSRCITELKRLGHPVREAPPSGIRGRSATCVIIDDVVPGDDEKLQQFLRDNPALRTKYAAGSFTIPEYFVGPTP